MQHRGCQRDVGSVGEAHGHQLPVAQPVVLAGCADEAGQLTGPRDDVVDVEDPFGYPAEPARHAVFADQAPWRQHPGPRVQTGSERGDLLFVAAGAVQREQHG